MTVVARYVKAVLALVFSAAPFAVVEVLNLSGALHVTVPGWETVVVACTPLLALLGVATGPANAPKPAPVEAPKPEGVPFTVAKPEDGE